MASLAGRAVGGFIGSLLGRTATSGVATLARPGARFISQGLSRSSGSLSLLSGVPRSTIRSQAGRLAAFGAAGGAFELGSRALPGGASFPGGSNLGAITAFGGGQDLGDYPGDLPSSGMNFGTTYITRTWTTNEQTGFPFFMALADGRIVVTRSDGSLKSYRPHKPVVFSKKPTIPQMVKAQRKLNRLRTQVKKEFGLKER